MATLITGGTGFIGAEIARRLLAGGATDITAFDISDSPRRLDEIADQVRVVRGDLGNFSQVLDAVRESSPRTIYHMGSMLSIPSDADPPAAFRVNAMGTYHVLEAARLFGVEQVLFASSTGTYAEGMTENFMDDLTLQRPRLFYGACKLFGENMGQFYRRKYNLDFRGVRYPPIVGPGVRTPGITQYISWSIEESANGNAFAVWAREDTRAPVLYFKDAARAMVMLAQTDADRIETVNYLIAGAQPTPSAGELVEMVRAKIPGARISFEIDNEIQALLDIALKPIEDGNAHAEWDWEPEYGLEEMVDDFLKELKDNPQRY